jgi:hypothetical protein
MLKLKHLKIKIFGNFLGRKAYIQEYPRLKVKVDKKTGEIIPDDKEIETKSPQEMKYKNKFSLNPDHFHDYEIIGAEIFKNSYKDIFNEELLKSNEIALKSLSARDIENEIYTPKMNELKFHEPNKYYKHFTRRIFYDNAHPKFRHMFVPSWRYKIEPFNSIHIFRWSLKDGTEKSHYEEKFKRNSYVEGFSPPFILNSPEIEELIQKFKNLATKYNFEFNKPEFQKSVNDIYNPPEKSENEGIREYAALVDQFVNMVPQIHFKIFPNLFMRLFYEINLNSKPLWITLEQEILNNLHHYNVTEISQINYIVTLFSPKFTTGNFRVIIAEEVYNRLSNNTLNLDELNSIALGFRYTKKRIIFDTIAENMIKRKQELLVSDRKTLPRILSEIMYSYAANRPKTDGTYTYYPQKELKENFLSTYEKELNDNILKMNAEEVSRVATALYLLKTDDVDPFINRIERNLIKMKNTSPEKIDAWSLHAVIRAFSKMKENKMCGSDKFFDEMEPIIEKHIENFKLSFGELSDIIYAYSIRGSGSEKFWKILNQKINENLEQANTYQILHNIFWHFLFIENKNLEQWRVVLKKFNEIEGRPPIYYYRPFKIAGYFLQNAFPEDKLANALGDENLVDFFDRFYDPEQVYDYVKYENLFFKHSEYSNFRDMLNARLFLFPVPFMVLENTFIIHMCWENRKIGINIWLERHLVPKTNGPRRVNKQHLVHSKMLKYQGWEILDLTWDDFMNISGQIERDKFLHNWVLSTSKEQEKKGVFILNPNMI